MTIRERIYRSAASLAKQVETRTGPFGKAVGGIEIMAGDFVEGAKVIAGEVQDETEALCMDLKIAKRTIVRKTRELCDYVENTFYTGGKFDSDKAKEALRNQGESLRQYGVKFCRTLAELAERGKDSIVTDFRNYVPTERELNTIYSGIGTEYNGTLLRPHYESCLSFVTNAGSRLPRGLKFRAQILGDIKASASDNPLELRKYYAGLVTSVDERRKAAPDKLKVLDKYFP